MAKLNFKQPTWIILWVQTVLRQQQAGGSLRQVRRLVLKSGSSVGSIAPVGYFGSVRLSARLFNTTLAFPTYPLLATFLPDASLSSHMAPHVATFAYYLAYSASSATASPLSLRLTGTPLAALAFLFSFLFLCTLASLWDRLHLFMVSRRH